MCVYIYFFIFFSISAESKKKYNQTVTNEDRQLETWTDLLVFPINTQKNMIVADQIIIAVQSL